jgi:hypothetical protein
MTAATRRQAATNPPRWGRFLARRNIGTGHRIEFEIIITTILAVGRQPIAIGYDFNIKYLKNDPDSFVPAMPIAPIFRRTADNSRSLCEGQDDGEYGQVIPPWV